jgi:hypothetical protein
MSFGRTRLRRENNIKAGKMWVRFRIGTNGGIL